MKPDRTVLKTIQWQHPEQTPELMHGLLSHLGAQRLEVAMEPSGTYGDALRWLFVTHGVAVFRLSPKRVHDSAEVFDGVPSLHDAKAAYQIGRLHLDGVSQRWEERSEQRRELAAQIAVLKLCTRNACRAAATVWKRSSAATGPNWLRCSIWARSP